MSNLQTVLLVGGTGRTGARVLQQLTSIFAPRQTRMANVAHFMCELVTSSQTWEVWKGKMPVIIDVTASKAPR